ncbi:hypothetical protein LTR36_001412 [Oleoguttula mirabilis]|uniref:Uncharacterized protein n=1 Tax=Oleoguttula mirabilis TaxID=1507867 RepID=A0AAV9JQG5_9PEZI|nr:hypothetical protein LTR36_001412 [Oleoguttula mirabilis]
MTSLKELNLNLDDAWYGKHIMQHIASCQPLPPLVFINLMGCSVQPRDLYGLLQGCCGTLKEFYALNIRLTESAERWLLSTFSVLAEQMKVEHLKLNGVFTDAGRLDFPTLDSAIFWDDEDEEDYIFVEGIAGVEFVGAEEVIRGVPERFEEGLAGREEERRRYGASKYAGGDLGFY